jgi:hypothetical protein
MQYKQYRLPFRWSCLTDLCRVRSVDAISLVECGSHMLHPGSKINIFLSWGKSDILTHNISRLEFFFNPTKSFSKHSLLILLHVTSSSSKMLFLSSARANAWHPSMKNPFHAKFICLRHVFPCVWNPQNQVN